MKNLTKSTTTEAKIFFFLTSEKYNKIENEVLMLNILETEKSPIDYKQKIKQNIKFKFTFIMEMYLLKIEYKLNNIIF